jgi:hypothetical protein
MLQVSYRKEEQKFVAPLFPADWLAPAAEPERSAEKGDPLTALSPLKI